MAMYISFGRRKPMLRDVQYILLTGAGPSDWTWTDVIGSASDFGDLATGYTWLSTAIGVPANVWLVRS